MAESTSCVHCGMGYTFLSDTACLLLLLKATSWFILKPPSFTLRTNLWGNNVSLSIKVSYLSLTLKNHSYDLAVLPTPEIWYTLWPLHSSGSMVNTALPALIHTKLIL